MSSSSGNVWEVLLEGKHRDIFSLLADLGVNQEFLTDRQLHGILPLKAAVAMDTVAFVGLWPFKDFKGGDFSSTADHLTRARPHMCKEPQ